MDRKLIPSLILLSFLTCSLVPLTAQPASGFGTNYDETLEAQYISRSFQVFVRGRADYKGLYYFERPGQPRLIEVNYGQKSASYDYRGLPEFTIFRIKPGIGEEPDTYLPVGTADFSDKGPEVLVFLTPSRRSGDESGFSVAAINSISQSIPPGNVAFFNGTKATMQGVLASRRLVIPPGLSDPIPTSGIDTGEHQLLGLTVRAEGTLKVVLEANVRFVPNRRTLYVLMPPTEPDSFQINAFRMIEGD